MAAKHLVMQFGAALHDDITSAFPEADSVCCLDDFTVGPVGPLRDVDALCSLRLAHWRRVYGVLGSSWPSGLSGLWAEGDAQVAHKVKSANRISIFVGRTHQDQVFSVFALLYLQAHGVPEDRVEQFNCVEQSDLAEETAPAYCRVSIEDMRHADSFWSLRCALPRRPKPKALGLLPNDLRRSYDVCASRHPLPGAQFSQLDNALIDAVPITWTQGSRVLADLIVCFSKCRDRLGDCSISAMLQELAKRDDPPVEVRRFGREPWEWEIRRIDVIEKG